jgi:hypothetical protein
MAIKKEITQDATGVSVAYHVVLSVTADKAGQTVTGAVSSYVSEDAKAAGKQAVGTPIHVTVSGLPGAKENAFTFFENQLVAPQPADAASQPTANFAYGGASRYTFADGTVVADV